MVWLLLNVVVEISCWQQRQRVELHGIHFHVWWLILAFISFSLLMMVLVQMICFRLVLFLKAIMGSVLKVYVYGHIYMDICMYIYIYVHIHIYIYIYVNIKFIHFCLKCESIYANAQISVFNCVGIFLSQQGGGSPSWAPPLNTSTFLCKVPLH